MDVGVAEHSGELAKFGEATPRCVGVRVREGLRNLDRAMCLCGLLALFGAATPPGTSAAQIDIPGPPGSVAFGSSVTVLPNGNIVVTDPEWADGPFASVGAIYLYSPAGELISTLTGQSIGDHAGSGGVTVLENGNYVIRSPLWNYPDFWAFGPNAGAVTRGDAGSGISGVISAENSLIGTTAQDHVGSGGVTALHNGNYVVSSPDWDYGLIVDAGAVTWASGSWTTAGVVTAINSLVGTTAGDQVGSDGVAALTNGNYIVISPQWDNGSVVDAGAATWGSGSTGITGLISVERSLVGGINCAHVGLGGVTALSNGNYVVRSDLCSADSPYFSLGAATWGNGESGTSGFLSDAATMTGTNPQPPYPADFQADGPNVVALSNGNYVVVAPNWHLWEDPYYFTQLVGAVTWVDGSTGFSGFASIDRSLYGRCTYDLTGITGVTALANGNYVVASPFNSAGTCGNWVGAVTWADGSTVTAALVSADNSLTATSAVRIGWNGVTALTNGNYVAASPFWADGAGHHGAVTWGNGTTGLVGTVSASNSLIGAGAEPSPFQYKDVIALSNGNYVVCTSWWNSASAAGAGAATWGNGNTGVSGLVSEANSLVGSTANDAVCSAATALKNGNYVIVSPDWDNGGIVDAGAVTWADGNAPTAGSVTALNSLTGSTAADRAGSGGVIALGDGRYVAISPDWDNGAVADAGAITLARGDGASNGPITAESSVLGTAAGGGSTMVFGYDTARKQLAVGRPASNIVTLLALPRPDLVFGDGFE